MNARTFGAVDWFILGLYAAGLLGMGLHFSRRQRTTEEYFVGGRNMRPFLAGLSLFTAMNSIIAYIGIPGEYIQNGPALIFIANIAPIPIIYFVVGWWVIPVIMRLPITSVYELLEGRLGRSVRQTGSITFIVTRLVWMSLILNTSSSVLVDVVGCDRHWTYVFTILTGLVTTTYTLFGGIRTVMTTEVVQLFMLVGGALLTIASVTWRLGGFGAWWPHQWEHHWQVPPFFSADPHVRDSLVGAFVTFLITSICSVASDQAAVQRFLTTRDAPSARRTYLLSNVAGAIVATVLSMVGAALLGFFQTSASPLAHGRTFTKDADALFPVYIGHFLPAGIAGLVVASLLASAMSCLSSGINATITVVTKDFVDLSPHYAGRSEAAKIRLTRFLALIFGLLVILCTFAVGAVRGNLFEVSGKTLHIFVCPLFGLFFLALFIPYSTPFGAIIGAVYSLVAGVLIGFWDMLTNQAGFSFLWIAPVALVVSLAGGCLFSLLPTRGRSGAVLCLYATAALTPLAAVVAALIAHFHRAIPL